jgi:Mg-chelatase subunit ChlI
MSEQVLTESEEDAGGHLSVIVTIKCADAVAKSRGEHHNTNEDEEKMQILREQNVINQDLGKHRSQKAKDRTEEGQAEDENETTEKWRDEREETAEAGECGAGSGGHLR